MKLPRRTALFQAVGLATLISFAPLAQAQPSAYPNKPIRLVVTFAAGSTTDIIARAISDKLSQSLGVPVVVENRAGASGTVCGSRTIAAS